MVAPPHSPADAHAWFLRGINVGGRHILPMAVLRDHLTALGGAEVRTYIQSGNVVFRADPRTAGGMMETFERDSLERYGFLVPVVARSAAELAVAVAANPFLDGVASQSAANGEPLDHKRYHLGLLRQAPAPAVMQALAPSAWLPERYAVVGREVYIDLPNGMGTSKLMTSKTLAPLSAEMTVRNWRTILTMLALAHE